MARWFAPSLLSLCCYKRFIIQQLAHGSPALLSFVPVIGLWPHPQDLGWCLLSSSVRL